MATQIVFPPPLLSFTSPEASLEIVGGKGANLAHLARAGLPVPAGFLAPTALYRDFVAANRLEPVIDDALHGLSFDDPAALEAAALEAAAQRIRQSFDAGSMAPEVLAALAAGYAALGAPPVAVRSSATAEDLPDLSFAGQQDTFLNVQGFDALPRAIIRCWSSLWTARAIGYRARNGIAQQSVALAVVVQRMAPAEASGVLFTANPLTGRRGETVIDATLGLGEALVSGQVEPDHYVVDPGAGAIRHKTLGAKATVITGKAGGGTITTAADASTRQAIPDPVILELTQLGRRVAALYDVPQDIEWAWAGGQLFLLQSRPITSLFPLPDGMPPAPLRVMMAFAAVQGIFEPLTPLGQDTMKLVLTGAGRALGYDTDIGRQNFLFIAAERLYIDGAPVLRNAIGRQVLPRVITAIDPGVAQAFSELVHDPRLAPKGLPLRLSTLRRLLRFVLPKAWRIGQIWRNPDGERKAILRMMDDEVAKAERGLQPTGDLWTDYVRALDTLASARRLFPDFVIPHGMTAVVASMVPFFGIMQRFARQAARSTGQPEVAHLPLEIARGLPHNVTTEMDLALWQTAQVLRADPVAAHAFAAEPAADLAALYLDASLPYAAQAAIGAFMHRYGMRGLGEIDIGRPRWREQPEPVMQVLQSYLRMDDTALAPDVIFARGADAAAIAADRLEAAVRKTRGGRVKARLVRWAVLRYRALAGMREAPKFFAIRMLGIIRQSLLQSGASFTAAGLLDQPDDLFFLYERELQEMAQQRGVPPQLRTRIAQRRELRGRELRRKQLPRVLLSDGMAYYEGVRAIGGDAASLIGDPVSPGVAEGIVRVIFNPAGTQLAPAEILVCPGTDPAWTPLFLAAGGLVMEVGGMMTHGSVVAREYGIPAVVGVHEATTRLQAGQRVRVDGSNGVITLLSPTNYQGDV